MSVVRALASIVHQILYLMLDAQGYPIFLVDIFMTFILQAGFSKRHQKAPNWAVVLKSSLHGKMKLFPAASPAAAIAANRGITLVCLLHLCSFYRECELFFIHTSIWQVFFARALIFFINWICLAFKLKSPQTGELLWCACFTFVPSIENVSYFSYFNLTSFFQNFLFCLQVLFARSMF